MVEREEDYYLGQSQMVTGIITGIITGIGTGIALLMGIGAVFGAINTMYTAVASRTREIATLRALGFSSGPVVISVMAESVALSIAGGALGGFLAYAGFNGYQTATINWQTFSQVAFAFTVTPTLLIQGIVWAVVMGFVGGIFPALRAARLPVATALRELQGKPLSRHRPTAKQAPTCRLRPGNPAASCPLTPAVTPSPECSSGSPPRKLSGPRPARAGPTTRLLPPERRRFSASPVHDYRLDRPVGPWQIVGSPVPPGPVQVFFPSLDLACYRQLLNFRRPRLANRVVEKPLTFF